MCFAPTDFFCVQCFSICRTVTFFSCSCQTCSDLCQIRVLFLCHKGTKAQRHKVSRRLFRFAKPEFKNGTASGSGAKQSVTKSAFFKLSAFSVYFFRAEFGQSDTFLCSGQNRFDNFLKVVKSYTKSLLILYSTVSFFTVPYVQKTAPLSFCTPPDLHSALYKTNREWVLNVKTFS